MTTIHRLRGQRDQRPMTFGALSPLLDPGGLCKTDPCHRLVVYNERLITIMF